jgi:peptidoglycan/xylan/chitin deacetylase (PgdA/CDA1 family)
MPHTLTIFMYHAVVRSRLAVYHRCFIDEPDFRAQVEQLQKRYELLSLSEGAARLRAGSLAQPAAVVTLDDGFLNNYRVAFPILRAYGTPAAIFLVTGLIDTAGTVWYCQLHRALTATSRTAVAYGGRTYDLSSPDAKARASAAIAARLKRLDQTQLLAELQRICALLEVDPDEPLETDSPFRMLDGEAIAAMGASGLIEFGAHTASHAILSRLDPGQARAEIEPSVQAVRQMTGRPGGLFAYPNGSAADFTAGTIALLQTCGVHTAVTAIPGRNRASTPRLELKRYAIGAKRYGRWTDRLSAWIRSRPWQTTQSS